MAGRLLTWLPRCRSQSFSFVKLADGPLFSRKGCFYHSSTVLKYSTPNNQPLNQDTSAKKSDALNDFERKFKTERYHEKLQAEGYTPIYKFRLVQAFTGVNKVKWQQLYLTSGLVSVSIVLASLGLVDTDVPFVALLMGGVTTSTFAVFAALFRRVIGAVLLSQDGQTVCISYVDNKGQRQDDLIPVGDIVPFQDASSNKYTDTWFIRVCRYTEVDANGEIQHEPYLMFVQSCDILDKKKFMEVFGSLL